MLVAESRLLGDKPGKADPIVTTPLGGMRMARLFLITLLVLSSGPTYAEWVLVDANNSGETVYVDPNNIRRKGDLVKRWALCDFKTIQAVWDTSFLSRESQHEYDCREVRTRRLALTYSSGNMGSGTVIYSDAEEQKWEPVQPGSVSEATESCLRQEVIQTVSPTNTVQGWCRSEDRVREIHS